MSTSSVVPWTTTPQMVTKDTESEAHTRTDLATMLRPQEHGQAHRNARILSSVAATIIALSCGTNYGFSAWAPQFANRMALTATQINLMGNFGNIGMYAMGIPGGILIDSRGPRWGVFPGCVALAIGYFGLRNAFDSGPGSVGMSMLCVYMLLTGAGGCTAFSAAIKASASNWPMHRGTATAFPLSALGLSAFFYTTLAGLVWPNDTSVSEVKGRGILAISPCA